MTCSISASFSDEQGIREGSIARTMHLKKGESEALPLYCQGSYVPFEYLLNIIGGVPTVNVDEKGTVVQTDACVVSNAIGDSSRDNIEDNEVADSVAESVVDANIPRGFHSANEALSSSQDIMYIGDHIHGDVVPTSKLRKWISVAVVGTFVVDRCIALFMLYLFLTIICVMQKN